MIDNDNESTTISLAYYMVENRTTIRNAAKEFNIPKSTIHHLLNNNLKHLNYQLYIEVKNLLNENFSIKHIRGGESTKIKYEKLRKLINKNDEIEALNL